MLPRVYALGEATKLARCFAVTQWQPLAVVSHRTAGWLYGWLDEPDLVEATVPSRVKVATPLHDCLTALPPDEANRLVDQQLSRSVTSESMRQFIARNPGRWGNRAALRQLHEAATHAASEPERILARAFARRNFDIAANAPVGPYFGDFVDNRARLVVEVDGREFHSEPEAFRRDRRRQNRMILAGWMVLRYAAADVFADAEAIADEVIAVARKRRHTRA